MKSDVQLQQQVLAGLSQEVSDTVNISVEVKNGIVMLVGHVDNYADKWDAEQVAQSVMGIRELVVAVDVFLPEDCERDDVDIVRAIDDALASSTLVPADVVRVVVKAGRVTLTGEMTWNFQREAVARTVRKQVGVMDIVNRIAIAPYATTMTKNEQTDAALQRRERRSARQIAVTVDGAEFT